MMFVASVTESRLQNDDDRDVTAHRGGGATKRLARIAVTLWTDGPCKAHL